MIYVDVFLLPIQCSLTLKLAGTHLSVQMEPCSAKRDWWVTSPSIFINFTSFIHTIILLFMAIQFKVIFPFILHQDH